MRLLLSNRMLLPSLAAVLVFVLSMGALGLVARADRAERLSVQRQTATLDLGSLRSRLEGLINAKIFLGQGLVAYVAVNGDISQEVFDGLAREVFSDGRLIRNIGLARGYEVEFAYPLEGNEAIIGLDYRTLPAQFPAVERAIELGKTVVAGPVALVQGGEAFINRTPILLSPRGAPRGSGGYWGLASVVIDKDQLLQAAGLTLDHAEYRLAIRGKDGLGEKGEVFWGDGGVFADDPVIASVVFPSGSWQLGAVPLEGWQAGGKRQNWLWWVGGALTMILSLVSGYTVHATLRFRHSSLHDPLTGLANRLMLEERTEQAVAAAKRHRRELGFAVLDLDGFKPVNDRFGHHWGDVLLKQVARRLRSQVRQEDVVARVGGDEFVVLFVELDEKQANGEQLVHRLQAAFTEPFIIDSQPVRLQASVGVVLYPHDAKRPRDLMRLADQAMYRIKDQRRRVASRSGAE